MVNRSKNPLVCSSCGNVGGTSHKGMCLACYNHLYYKNNREKIIQNSKEWSKNNPEKNRKLKREGARRRWKRLTKEEKRDLIRRQEKRRTEDERKRRRERQRRWYQNVKNTQHQKDKNRECKERRRAKINNVENTLTKVQWEKIKEAYGYKCAYCGCQPSNLTQDHVIPISKGGNHSANNIVPACAKCNRKKWSNPPPVDFVMKEILF